MVNYFKLAKWILWIVPLGIVVVTSSTTFPFIVGKYVWLRLAVSLTAILYALGLFLGNQTEADKYWERLKDIVKSKLGLAISIFTGVFLLAGFMGVDPWFSFWSNYERGEGGLQIMTFYIFFLMMGTLLENSSDWRKMLWSFILSTWLMIGYGIMAGFGWGNFLGVGFDQPNYRFQGSIGNPAYVAVYLLFAMFFTSYLYLKNSENKNKVTNSILAISLASFAITFLFTATRGAFLGLIFGLIVTALYLAWYYPKWRWILVGLLVGGVILLGTLIVYRDTEPIKSWPASRLLDLSFTTQTFSDRTIIWGIAYEGIKERPMLGYGPGNFLSVFYKHYDPTYFKPGKDYGAWFDRAHNIFLDYLIAGGILLLFSYLAIFLSLGWLVFNKKNKIVNGNNKNFSNNLLGALFISVPLSYLVQGIVLFDVSTTYLAMFIFFALVDFTYREKNHKL